MVTQNVAPQELRAESQSILSKAADFERVLGERQAAVMALKWEGVAKRAFHDMFTRAGEEFKLAKGLLDTIGQNLATSAAKLQQSHNDAAGLVK